MFSLKCWLGCHRSLKGVYGEDQYPNLATTILKVSLGSKASDNEKVVQIMSNWIMKMNPVLDRELGRYKLRW